MGQDSYIRSSLKLVCKQKYMFLDLVVSKFGLKWPLDMWTIFELFTSFLIFMDNLEHKCFYHY